MRGLAHGLRPQWACVFLSRGKRGTKRPLAGVGAGAGPVHPSSHSGLHLRLPPAWEADDVGTPTGGAGAEPTARGLGRLSPASPRPLPCAPLPARCGLALIQAPVSLWGQRAPGPAPALPPPPSSPPPRAGQAPCPSPRIPGKNKRPLNQQDLRLSAARASPAPTQGCPLALPRRTCNLGKAPSSPLSPRTRVSGTSRGRQCCCCFSSPRTFPADFFRENGRAGERQRQRWERRLGGLPPHHGPGWESNLQLRHVPWMRIELGTPQSSGRRPIH